MAVRRARKAKKAKKSKTKRVAVKRRSAGKSRKAKSKTKAKAKRGRVAKARRAAPRKAKKASPRKAKTTRRKDVIGEGNYTATREFDKEQSDFVKRNKARIPQMGKDAEAALEGPSGAELRQAEEEAKSHSHGDDAE